MIATICKNIYYIDKEGKVGTLAISGSMGINSVVSVTEDKYGSIWAATQGNGIFIFSEDGILNYTRSADYSQITAIALPLMETIIF